MLTSRAPAEPRTPRSRRHQVMIEETDPNILKLRNACMQRGASGIIGIGRCFRNSDDSGNKLIDIDEFRKAVHDFGLNFSKADVDTMFKAFDKDSSGSIDFNEFLEKLRV